MRRRRKIMHILYCSRSELRTGFWPSNDLCAAIVTKAHMLTRSRGQKFLSKKQVFFLRTVVHVILETNLYYQAISTICISAPICQNTFPSRMVKNELRVFFRILGTSLNLYIDHQYHHSGPLKAQKWVSVNPFLQHFQKFHICKTR